MTAGVPLLLKLFAAHLLGDYLFQSDRIAGAKHRPLVLLLHVAVHAILLVLVTLSEPFSLRLVVGLALVLAVHALTDAWTSRRPRDLKLFLLDQGAHLASLVLAAAIARPDQWASVAAAAGAAWVSREAWTVVCGGLVAVPAGATFVSRWVRPFQESLSDESRDQRRGLEQAGRWIGMLERLLVYAAVLARLEALIGFVIAVKAVLRLPEAREKWSRELAEYYLVGSLMSLAWALVTALVVRALLAAGLD